MLDIRFIREHPDLVQDGARKKHIDVDIGELLQVDAQRRQLIANVESLKALRNKTSKEIPSLQGDAKQAAIAHMKQVAAESKELESALKDVEATFEELMLRVPNVPEEDVPEGESDADNVVLRTWGDVPAFDFEPRDHVELGELLGVIDIRAASSSPDHACTF
jgi:seryl-tRNA synthetase